MSRPATGVKSRPLEKTNHPGIYKRGGKYVVIYRDPQGRQRKRAADTLTQAKDIKASVRTDITRGEFRELSRATLTDYAPRWIESYVGRTRRGVSDDTRDDYRDALERDILPALGRFRLTEIAPADIKTLAKRLTDRGLAPSSVTKTLAPLKALLASAVEEGLIRSNPAAGVRLAQPLPDTGEEPEKAKALTDLEYEALMAELPAEWRPFFAFLGETGLRISEALELRYRDVDGDWLKVDRQFYRGNVRLPKGRKRRRVPLSTAMGQLLWARRKEAHAKPDDLVFTSALGRRIISSNLMGRVLKPAAVRAGLGVWVDDEKGAKRADTWVGFHTFRHTSATRLFRSGWNPTQVALFLGHSDAGFTLRTYVHLLDEDLPRPDFAARAPGATSPRQPIQEAKSAILYGAAEGRDPQTREALSS